MSGAGSAGEDTSGAGQAEAPVAGAGGNDQGTEGAGRGPETAAPPAGELPGIAAPVGAAPLPAAPPTSEAPAAPAGSELDQTGRRGGELCTVVVDVRGLGRFERDQFSYVYGPGGERLWPTPQQAANVDGQLANEGLLTYFRSEGDIAAAFGSYTVIKAASLARNPDATAREILSSSQLGPAAAAQFQQIGAECRLAYLY
ncbi:hypothetical protein Deipr_0578 [Deinococcus proteolyticus MRP]|uniref:Uncharacterized protein n=1 Tax=Deinococcus proteolyticus (strain ATCC 35074 / DSM 20540 / JCM 6276 / NBRC 101906 / NCIMB 13154 / VKM Ac-1939 / CCM 2703 / MRP) TaxID=693977 RepID=F0RKW7_DEIPM|nr:hypothetical protein Deipr_0578 [Deinococcus proteolyticus MRP]